MPSGSRIGEAKGESEASSALAADVKAKGFDNTSSEKSHVARCRRAVRVTISECCQTKHSSYRLVREQIVLTNETREGKQ